jgi:drug/metabolite transporter (DMT)-like permease
MECSWGRGPAGQTGCFPRESERGGEAAASGVIAVLGGLGAALAWAVTTLTAARASPRIGPWSTLAWVMLTGLIVVGPAAVAQGIPAGLDRGSIAWLAIAGIGNVSGLLLVYSGLRIGKVGVVAPISSSEGAVAAVVAVVAGEHVGAWTAVALVVVAVGIVLAARPPVEREEAGRDDPRAAALAMGAALAFGASLYATGRASLDLPIAWAVLPPRLLGVLLVTVPLVATRRLRLTRPAAPFVVAGGLAEVAGFACYAIGARHGIAIAAVLASQFAAIAALGAAWLFKEHLTRVGAVGVAVIAVGVAVVSALQA